MSKELKAEIAYHEAGHAVATVLAWRNVRWPILPPPLPIKHVSITEEETGKWSGICVGPQVYSTQWLDTRIGRQWRDAMEWQLVIIAAGGVAEATHRCERNKRDNLWFALFNCSTDGDLESAEAILADLQRLTGHRYGLQRFSRRACVLLHAHWGAVERIAAALIESNHVDGDRVCEIFDLAVRSKLDIAYHAAGHAMIAHERDVGLIYFKSTKIPTRLNRCIDCGCNTCPRGQPHEYYMVHDTIWAAAGMTPDGGSLCVECIERRLGRQLNCTDFIDALVNDPNRPHSARLRDRFAATPTTEKGLT